MTTLAYSSITVACRSGVQGTRVTRTRQEWLQDEVAAGSPNDVLTSLLGPVLNVLS